MKPVIKLTGEGIILTAVFKPDFPVFNEERRAGDPPELIASNAKAKKILGWKPVNSGLKNIIQSALVWHSKNN